MPTLCLNMIVRNEAAIIRRALESARPYIDCWAIIDTGSSDDTIAIIRATLADLPGALIERPWVDFAHNRNEAYELARGRADYALFMDADMVIEADEPFSSRLEADGYLVRYTGPLDYSQVMLVSTRHEWRYEGVTHEALRCSTAERIERADFLRLTHFNDGSSRETKMQRDLELLEGGLRDDPDNTRYIFYLAQTLEQMGRLEDASARYVERANRGGWDEETWYCHYRLGVISERLDRPWNETLELYLRAYSVRPARLEPIYRIVRHYRESGEYSLGDLFGALIERTPYPEDVLFIERDVYAFQLPMEYAICAHWSGHAEAALRIYNGLMEHEGLPSLLRHALIANRQFSVDALYPAAPVPRRRHNYVRVVVPFHNPGPAFENCLATLLTQDYGNFSVVFVDDASSDGSADLIPDDPRFAVVTNATRRGGAYSLHKAFLEHCGTDDIVVQLDGDDWLAVHDALSHIDSFYDRHDCWVMYGQYRSSSGEYGLSRPFSDARSFREHRRVWFTSAIRTFRGGLYHRIADYDPEYTCMKDATGDWYTEAMDMAYMYPVVELAGLDRVRFNDRVLYVYNVENPHSVHRERRAAEVAANREIAAKPPFPTLDTYRAPATRRP